MLDRPIFLSGLRKSGTSMTRMLLDGHPDFYVHPINEFHFFHFTKFVDRSRPSHRRASKYKPQTMEEAHQAIIEDSWIGAMDKWGDRRPPLEMAFDREKYSALIKDGRFSSYKEMYELVVSSAPQCDDRFSGDFSKLRSVVKGIQQEEHLPEFLQMFPDLKFVYILRNPYAQLNASLNAQRTQLMSAADQVLYNNEFEEMDLRAPFPYLGDRIRQLSLSYFFMDKWKAVYPDNFYVLNYDELLTDPEPNLRKLCEFLEIKFDPIMLKTTRGGEDTKGSGWSTSAGGANHDSSAISTAPLHKWKEQLLPGVIKLINYLFLDIIEENGFEVAGNKGFRDGDPIHPNEDEETRAANKWLFSVYAGRLI